MSSWSSRLGLSHWDPYVMHRGGCLELYYCNMVEWCWWDSGLICKTNWFPSVLWYCWFGHMTCKNRPWYNLLSERLNLAQSFNLRHYPCSAILHKCDLTKSLTCNCGQQQTMSHILDACPLTKFDGGLQLLHEAELMQSSGWSESTATTAYVKWMNKHTDSHEQFLQVIFRSIWFSFFRHFSVFFFLTRISFF